jgi:hypothetical protein
LHSEKLNALYRTPKIILEMKSIRIGWAGHVARMGEMRSAYSVLVEKPEGKRPLGKPRHRWDDNTKMNFQ